MRRRERSKRRSKKRRRSKRSKKRRGEGRIRRRRKLMMMRLSVLRCPPHATLLWIFYKCTYQVNFLCLYFFKYSFLYLKTIYLVNVAKKKQCIYNLRLLKYLNTCWMHSLYCLTLGQPAQCKLKYIFVILRLGNKDL